VREKREIEREREMLVDESSRKRFGEGPKGLRKMGGGLVFDSMALSFSFLIFLHSQGYHHTA